MINRTENEIMSTWNYDKPLVSIICITYNHVNYIEKCLDGFLSQVTNFPIEIIIHDDASFDGTSNIVRKYEKFFPNIIRAIIQPENVYSKNPSLILKTFKEYVKGKYIASCEGDDYWTIDNKLQQQYDFLENHIEYFSVGHLTECIDVNGNKVSTFINTTSGEYSERDFNKWKLFSHYSSYFYRNFFSLLKSDEFDDFLNIKAPGDRKYPALFFQFGKLYVLPFWGSVYRYQSGPDSYTSNPRNMNLFKVWNEMYTLRKYCSEKKIKAKFSGRYRYFLLKIVEVNLKNIDKDSYKKVKKVLGRRIVLELFLSIPILLQKSIKKLFCNFRIKEA